MAINLTDSLNAATTKGKLGDAKQIYLKGDTKNLQQAYEETSTHFGTLDNRSTQMEETIKSIAATGGASQATAVTYDNANSQLTATNIQSAVDELQVSKIDNEFKSGIIYDVSAHNDGAVFESLSALLGDANLSTLIPTSVRSGGMTIRFIQGSTQSSDNKYVQYRLVSDEWSADTDNWSISDEGVYVDNPEFVYVKTDKDGKILWAIKIDGSIYYGAGVPQQVIDYINERIAELSLDEYGDIVAFLNNLEKSGKTLQNLLDEKVDKEEGKSLIDNEYASTKSTIDNPEFIEAKTDSEGKLLAGRTMDGAAFENVGFSTPNVSINGHIMENIEDPEGRSEITTDSEGKIISYRDADGIKHENVGIDVKKIITSEINSESIRLSHNGIVHLKNELNTTTELYTRPDIPLYGIVNIKSETFYLTSDSRYSDITGVEVRQELEDNNANAAAKLTIAHYYIKNTDVRLDFYAATKVTLVNGKYYVTASLEAGQVVPTSIEVTQVIGAPDVRTWSVDKKTEHYCIADFDFGDYYNKNNVAVGVKFQGASTLLNRKRNFRFTFYKNNTYEKKNKIKFGEMLRLSGYNLKANWTDSSRIKELILYPILLAIWKQRPEYNRFPWHNEFDESTAATGFIQGFPIRLYIAGKFYGMMTFGLKKDERNYVLDGDDDTSGIFVSGSDDSSTCWTNPIVSTWEDEMMDEMSQETADALNEWFDFINNRLVDKNQNPIPFNIKNIPSRLDVQGFIDYFICLQVFIMYDNTSRNMILHTRSDKKKFYPFFYDLDLSLGTAYAYDVDMCNLPLPSTRDMSFWKTIRDTFWDDIVKRYHFLRSNVLTIEYFKEIFHAYSDVIPTEDYTLENIRWDVSTSKSDFNSIINLLTVRLDYLDKNYFKY